MAEERGFKTDLTNIDPETGQMTWSVEYTANFDELYKEVSQLLDDAKGVAQKTNDPFFSDGRLNELSNKRGVEETKTFDM